MTEKESYTPAELKTALENCRTEERVIAVHTMSTAGIRFGQLPQMYRDGFQRFLEIVRKSNVIDALIKERFDGYIVMMANAVPMNERPKIYVDAYNEVFDILIRPAPEPGEKEKEE
jgi:hypothetical protein